MLRVGRPHFCCILSGAAASQQPLAVVARCCCCCCNSAYLRVFARQCYTNGNFEAVCGCLPSAGRDFCYQPRPPHASRLRHSAPPVACRLHNEPQPNKVKFIKSTEEKPKRMPKSRKTNENEILSECARVREVGRERGCESGRLGEAKPRRAPAHTCWLCKKL